MVLAQAATRGVAAAVALRLPDAFDGRQRHACVKQPARLQGLSLNPLKLADAHAIKKPPSHTYAGTGLLTCPLVARPSNQATT